MTLCIGIGTIKRTKPIASVDMSLQPMDSGLTLSETDATAWNVRERESVSESKEKRRERISTAARAALRRQLERRVNGGPSTITAAGERIPAAPPPEPVLTVSDAFYWLWADELEQVTSEPVENALNAYLDQTETESETVTAAAKRTKFQKLTDAEKTQLRKDIIEGQFQNEIQFHRGGRVTRRLLNFDETIANWQLDALGRALDGTGFRMFTDLINTRALDELSEVISEYRTIVETVGTVTDVAAVQRAYSLTASEAQALISEGSVRVNSLPLAEQFKVVTRRAGYGERIRKLQREAFEFIDANPGRPLPPEFINKANSIGARLFLDPASIAKYNQSLPAATVRSIADRTRSLYSEMVDGLLQRADEYRGLRGGITKEAARNKALQTFVDENGNLKSKWMRTANETLATYTKNLTIEEYARTQEAENDLPALKQWVTVGDSRVRASHVTAGNHPPIPLDEDFSVGGKRMSRPGDPRGGPAQTFGCRCSLSIHFSGYSQANAVPPSLGFDD